MGDRKSLYMTLGASNHTDKAREQIDDAVSRQAVRHILNHEVKMPIKVWKKLFELVDCLPPVNPQYTGNEFFNFDAPMVKKSMEQDAVSREAVIQTLNKMDRYTATELTLCDTDKKFPANEVFIVDDVYEQIIEQLPPVTPKSETVTEFADRCRECGAKYGRLLKEKSGKWILLDECANSGYYCSNCQKKLVKEGWSNTVKKINYCPNCGACMKDGRTLDEFIEDSKESED